MDFQLDLASTQLNLDHTLNCGQVFRWSQNTHGWIGVVDGYILKMRQIGDTLTVETSSDDADESFVKRYLRFDDPLPKIIKEIGKDDLMNRAASRLKGLRLVRQKPWECTASFVCASYKNIGAIRQMISNLCLKLGDPIKFGDTTYSSFPTPVAIAKADRKLIEACGLGYRTKLLIETARNIALKEIVLEDLVGMDYETARRTLISERSGMKTLPGVGPKIADCIMLFSLDHLDAFPIDIWIRRAVLRFYRTLFSEPDIDRPLSNLDRKESIGSVEYRLISDTMRRYFGAYAGYAQEYLYHYTRVCGPLLGLRL
jgi:N-glycosylase/DNA lyase